jgi:hypothetical protein
MYYCFAERQRWDKWEMLAFPQENLYIFPVLHDITIFISIWFDYNLKWNKTIETGGLIVGQDVTITLNLELNK